MNNFLLLFGMNCFHHWWWCHHRRWCFSHFLWWCCLCLSSFWWLCLLFSFYNLTLVPSSFSGAYALSSLPNTYHTTQLLEVELRFRTPCFISHPVKVFSERTPDHRFFPMTGFDVEVTSNNFLTYILRWERSTQFLRMVMRFTTSLDFHQRRHLIAF